ncbi:hypothetical protein NDA03_26580 [Trichocoleus sp. Lan]|uniref:hypothetical protein n=1 Tax=Trichocoleus sp. Lan TaxID=2933927 RepID=UPI0032971601
MTIDTQFLKFEENTSAIALSLFAGDRNPLVNIQSLRSQKSATAIQICQYRFSTGSNC